MSVIASVVQAALGLEQKVQTGVSAVARHFASSNFNKALQADEQALLDAENSSIQVEQYRAKRAVDLHAQFKAALVKLHTGADAELDLIEGRKTQALAVGHQLRSCAAMWQGVSINAESSKESARRAVAQLG